MNASAFADGCFVFRWNKQKDINEPTQKAIILYDQGREDLILQVKYEGPAEEFGWLIPVPARPEVRRGNMEPFYELSRLTQEHFREDHLVENTGASKGASEEPSVKVIEVKTIGAYEVTILSCSNPSALTDWLAAHGFKFPKEKESVLDQYIQRGWFFVAAQINPEGNGFELKSPAERRAKISASTRRKVASGELHPIIISFASQKCVFPLAISSVNGAASELSLYVLSGEPLANPVIFGRKFNAYKTEKDKWLAGRGDRQRSRQDFRSRVVSNSPLAARMGGEDPNDPPPASVFDRPGFGAPESDFDTDPDEDFYSPRLQLIRSMKVEGDAKELKGCRRDLPRITGKTWWLTKLVETFAPEDMVDLEFESAIPFLAERLHHDEGDAVAHCMPQYGSLAAPTVLRALNDLDASVRHRGLVAAAEIIDPRFAEPILKLMADDDPKARFRACFAAERNWTDRFVDPMVRLLGDPNRGIARAAQFCMNRHLDDVSLDASTLRRSLYADGPASPIALEVLQTRGELSDADRKRLFSSTNLSILSYAFSPLRDKLQVEELSPLMTNSLPMARMMALGVLARMADKPAVERIVSMLHDPHEAVRWRVRSTLRRLTGQKLGVDPVAYERWWAENKDRYVPMVTQFGSR